MLACNSGCAQDTDREDGAINALESRAAFLEFLAGFYFSPLTQGQVDALSKADFSACGQLNQKFDHGLEDMKKYLSKRNTGTRQELAVDFTGAFAGTSSFEGRVAVPYRSVFTSDEGLLMQEGCMEAYRTYKSEAVRKRKGMDWPEDHLSIMLQFLSLMSTKAADALRSGNREEAVRRIEISRQFAEFQLDDWTGEFFELAGKIVRTRFYRGVLEMTEGYLAFDRELLDDVLSEVGE